MQRIILTLAFGVAAAMPAMPAAAQLKAQVGTSQPAPPRVQAPEFKPEAGIEGARRITRDDAMKLVKARKAVYVDVRSRDQYDLGHIKGAFNVPLSDILTVTKVVPPGKFIVTYCA